MVSGRGRPFYIMVGEDLSEGIILEQSPEKAYAMRIEISTERKALKPAKA